MKLTLQHPVTPLHTNQAFGLDPTTYGQFGLKGHNGLDFRAYHGQPIYASHEGIANYEIDKSGGHGIDLVSENGYEINADLAYARTRYWHLCDPKQEPEFASPIYKKKNVRVKAGDLIGYADSTGFSTGDHLHFGLKAVDIKGKTLHYENGFKGAIDPAPFLAETEEQKVARLTKIRDILLKIVALLKRN